MCGWREGVLGVETLIARCQRGFWVIIHVRIWNSMD